MALVRALGLGHAMMCDFRIAAEDAKFTTAFSRRGLIAEYGLAWHLTQVAGRQVALDLLLTARVVLGDEMAQLGLVNRAVPVEEVLTESMALARDLAENVSPASMATIKRQVLTEQSLYVLKAIEQSNSLMSESLNGPDIAEGVMSFLEKRQAEFPSLGSGTVFNWMNENKD